MTMFVTIGVLALAMNSLLDSGVTDNPNHHRRLPDGCCEWCGKAYINPVYSNVHGKLCGADCFDAAQRKVNTDRKNEVTQLINAYYKENPNSAMESAMHEMNSGCTPFTYWSYRTHSRKWSDYLKMLRN